MPYYLKLLPNDVYPNVQLEGSDKGIPSTT